MSSVNSPYKRVIENMSFSAVSLHSKNMQIGIDIALPNEKAQRLKATNFSGALVEVIGEVFVMSRFETKGINSYSDGLAYCTVIIECLDKDSDRLHKEFKKSLRSIVAKLPNEEEIRIFG